MRKFLTLISLLFMLSAAVYAQSAISFGTDGRAQYSLLIQYKKAGITGVCMMKKDSSNIVGSIVNEFGVKAFDFRYDTEKDHIKLINVISFLNKWYIKKTIKADWRYLFSYPKKHSKSRAIYFSKDGEITLDNIKQGIKYSFKKIEE
ncbi:MAG TPA: hypothetical protein PLF38_03165 [Xylanibacter oryzae]|nr:hypothetical protein [Xylanibacter oryzae]